jgi:hypothetical protein
MLLRLDWMQELSNCLNRRFHQNIYVAGTGPVDPVTEAFSTMTTKQ